MNPTLFSSKIFEGVMLSPKTAALQQDVFVPVGPENMMVPLTSLSYMELMETHSLLSQEAEQLHMDMLMFLASGLSNANKQLSTVKLMEVNAVADEAITTAHAEPVVWLSSTPLMLRLEALLIG